MASTIEGRPFDTIKNQFTRNGDSSKRIVMKIDVEGAEWNSLQAAPDDIFKQIDQMSVEFHTSLPEPDEKKYLQVVRRLKQFFEVAHIHYNHYSCMEGLEPFPTRAHEVVFVSKRLAVVDRSRKVSGTHPLDAPNNAGVGEMHRADGFRSVYAGKGQSHSGSRVEQSFIISFGRCRLERV